MYYSTRVFALIALQLGLVYSFSWDIVLGVRNRLEFFHNGTITHTEHIPSANYIRSVTYDPVHYRLLFADNNNVNHLISSFELSTRTIQPLVTSNRNQYIYSLAYDPVTQLLFWMAGYGSIYSFSLDPTSSNKTVNEKPLATSNHSCWDIAVDSCGGYIYWITDYEIERARFDGSKREVLIDHYVNDRSSLAIDQQSQKMYWIEEEHIDGARSQVSIKGANLNGTNKTTFYIFINETRGSSLTISKDFIYWRGKDQNGILQSPKNPPQRVTTKLFSILHSSFCWSCQILAANYTINEQTEKNQNCENLKSLILNNSDASVLCVHGTKVSGESRCECRQGYTGESCDVYICQNYCFQGDCSVTAEGQPKCSCKAGYSGKRCEVNACHRYCLNSGVCSLNAEHDPVCNCKADYEGERCDISICKDYCLQGNCSVSAAGQPKCRCNDGYTGDRCEVNACHKHCLNDGVCSLNEEDEPFCECAADYEGERCDVAITQTGVNCDNMTQKIQQDLQSLKQVINEELQRTLQFYSDKVDKNESKI